MWIPKNGISEQQYAKTVPRFFQSAARVLAGIFSSGAKPAEPAWTWIAGRDGGKHSTLRTVWNLLRCRIKRADKCFSDATGVAAK